MQWLLALYVLVGLLFIGISIPLILRRIPPNIWYGFRVEKTLSNPDVWYEANAYSGKWLAIAGAALVVASVVVGAFGLQEHVFAGIMTGVMVLCTTVVLIKSFIYLKTL